MRPLLLLFLLLPACTDHYARTRAVQAPLRATSMSIWNGAAIDGQQPDLFAIDRTALVFSGIDSITPQPDEEGAYVFANPTRTGQPARIEGLGSGAVLTTDGYILTCEHVVENGPVVVALPVTSYNGRRGVLAAPARIIWSGSSVRPPQDLALLHADIPPQDASAPPASVRSFTWAPMTEARAGTRILVAGLGIDTSRTAAGHIIGGPTGSDEPPLRPDGQVHSFRSDVPAIPGDSGGPVVLPSGGLLGVATRITIKPATSSSAESFTTTITRPNPQFIERLITEDRARAVSPPAPAAAPAH